MGAQQDLEKQMDNMLVKKAPFQIPENGKKAIVRYLPIISLIFGILSLLAAVTLWNTANRLDDAVNTINAFNRAYGGDTINYGLFYYVAVSAIVIQGVLLLMAYRPLSQKLKKGWDLLLLSSVISFLFGVFYLLTDSGSLGNFIGTIIGTIIGLYILAQIRSHYKNGATAKPEK